MAERSVGTRPGKQLTGPGLTVLVLVVLFAAAAGAQESRRTWVFLGERDQSVGQVDSPSRLGITDRALWRRAKVLPADRLIDERDLPVSEASLDRIRALGLRVRSVSRWLNAVSVEGTREQLQQLRDLPFVQDIQPVRASRKRSPEVHPVPPEAGVMRKNIVPGSLNYGPSLMQLANIKVVDLHSVGVSGEGIIVGMIDDGYNNHRVHSGMKNIRVLQEYDFIHRDTNTSWESWEWQSGTRRQGYHGAYTLSAVGGYEEGKLIGSAYGSSFVLAKTEMDSVEIQAEEDLYVEALEWMEQLGADIVSTSLGYIDWYMQSDMNGQTAITTRAARIAASKGVLLVTAMGNEGNWQAGTENTMIAPADADSIVAVGATYSDGLLADFSSRGPTADGRIKPEVVAQGVSVVSADGNYDSVYVGVSGTSLATPLTAGAAALILSAHPFLTPMQVRSALIATATEISDGTTRTSLYPNNYYGYGRVDAFAAALHHGMFFSNRPTVVDRDTALEVSAYIVSAVPPAPDSVRLIYQLSAQEILLSAVMQPTSTEYLYRAFIPKSVDTSYPRGYISAYNGTDGTRTSPWGAPDSQFVFQSLITDVPTGRVPDTYVLRQNYPNPFNSGTVIEFEAPSSEMVELSVFNILGQRVATVFRGFSRPGLNTVRWEGTDDGGGGLATGMYLYRLVTPTSVRTARMLLLK